MDRRPGVFLDRDGTINVRAAEHDYIHDVDQFQWLPGALEGMVELARAGLPLIVVSNQRGVSRGIVSDATLRAIEDRIQVALAEYDCGVEAFRYCTHALEEHCECRKPRPGMLRDAARDLDIDLHRSWMIGDSDADIEAGRAAGCRTVRVAASPDGDGARTLLDAASIVLADRVPG